MNYWIHPDAEADLGDATVYYAKHASLAVAEAFLAEFERVTDLLVENQARGPHVDFGFACTFDRFPYTVLYEEDSGGSRIYAVALQHREPSYWRERT